MSAPQKSSFLRHQLLIDPLVQGSILRRTALYSAACAVYFIVILVFTESMSRSDSTFSEALLRCFDEAIYWAPGLILLAPLIAYDMLKLSNRFAGPIFRLRREMQRLVEGKSERELNFRDGDYWTEVAELFNKLRAEIIELRELKVESERRKNFGDAPATRSALFNNQEPAESDDFLSMTN